MHVQIKPKSVAISWLAITIYKEHKLYNADLGGIAMKRNVGGVDMVARLIIGVVLVAIGLAVPMSTVWQVILFLVAAVAVVTAVVRYCPANALMGINTYATDEVKSETKSEPPGGTARPSH